MSWHWAHSHLDQGSFVFATRGQWFAQDLGSDTYAAPGYFSPTRFNLYRTGTRGHNTLAFDGRNAECTITGTYSTANCSASPIVLFVVADAGAGAGVEAAGGKRDEHEAAAAPPVVVVDAYAIVDMSASYAYLGVTRAQRGFIIAAGRTVLYTVDEFELAAGATTTTTTTTTTTATATLAADDSDAARATPLQNVTWTAHTVANVTIAAGLAATLSTFNVSVAVTMAAVPSETECPGATMAVNDVDLLPPLLESPGMRRLQVVAPLAQGCRRIVMAVGVAPVLEGFAVRPLSEWAQSGPLE